MRREPAIPEQSASQLNQREVVDVLLVVPHQDSAALLTAMRIVRSTTHRRGLWPCDQCEPLSSPRRSGGCAVCIRLRSLLLPRWGCRTPYPGACAAAHPSVGSGFLTTILLDRRCQEPPVPGCSLRRITTLSGPPSPSVTRLFLVPFFLGRWESPSCSLRSGPCPASRRPAATPTAPRRVRHTRRPRTAQIPLADPAAAQRVEPVVDSALGSVPLGQLVPLEPLRIWKMIASAFLLNW